MLTGELRNQVDSIWNAFWTGGITDLNALGIEGVFRQPDVLELVRILAEVQSHAIA
jgi:hypothetical protein